MARPVWRGSIGFGLVNIPVNIYTATESHQPELHQYDAKTGKRVRYRRVIEGTNAEVPYQQIVDGYEVRKNKVVLLTDEELAAAHPRGGHTLELEEFVKIEAIDPIAWNHTYFVGPDQASGARKAYAVLREAMADLKRVGVGRIVMHAKQYLATLRPFKTGLALETMFFADEIRDIDEIVGGDAKASSSPRERGMAKSLIESMAGTWRHDRYEDSYRDNLLALVKRKAKGEVIETKAAPQAGRVIDLMEALKQSLGKSPAAAVDSARRTGGATRRPKPTMAATRSKGGPQSSPQSRTGTRTGTRSPSKKRAA